eukprot:15165_1
MAAKYDQNILHWLATITNGIMTMILIAMTIPLIQRVYKTKRKKSVILSGLAAIFSFTIELILLFTACVVSLTTNENITDSLAWQISFFAIVMYMISQTIMVYTFTVRIDKTFEGTNLAYSKCVVRGLYIASAVLIILGVSIVLSIVFKLFMLMLLGGIIWMFVYFVTTISLVLLFIGKIEQIMSVQSGSESEPNTGNGTQKNDKTVKAMTDAKLLSVVVKHGLLVPSAIISSFICGIVDISVVYVMGNDKFHAAASFWFALDATITVWCIFLLFGFNEKLYEKLCYPLHQSCEKCELSKLKRSNKLKTETKMTQNA